MRAPSQLHRDFASLYNAGAPNTGLPRVGQETRPNTGLPRVGQLQAQHRLALQHRFTECGAQTSVGNPAHQRFTDCRPR